MNIIYCLGTEGRLRNLQGENNITGPTYLYIDKHTNGPFVYTTCRNGNIENPTGIQNQPTVQAVAGRS